MLHLDLIARSIAERHASSALRQRGLDLSSDGPGSSQSINPIALALGVCTLVAYLVISTLVTYTMLRVIGTLVMVEDVASPADLADEVEGELLLDTALPVPRWRLYTTATSSAAITSGVRKTIRYLRAEAGSLSIFRGLGYALIYGVVEGVINGILSACLRPLISFAVDVLVPLFTPVLLWRLNNAWLHKVISRPSEKSWYARVREQKSHLTVKRAILVWALGRSVASFVPGLLMYFLVLRKFDTVDGDVRFYGSVAKTIFQSLAILALNMVLLLLLVVPATVILVRVQAAVLPADDEAIVVLDKALCKSLALESTDGNAASEPTAGGCKLTLLGMWRSFTWPAWITLLKVYAKCYAIEVALTMACTVVVIGISLAFKSP